MSKPVALTVAGSDPSGGAGIQADLKTFHQFGVYGEAAITLLTVQNTQRVSRVEILDPALVREQIEAVLEDIPPGAVKTGALGNAAMIQMVASLNLRGAPLVVDPVMVSKHGAPLVAADAVAALKSELLPRAALVTPNLPEAEALTGLPIATPDDARRAAEAILAMGPQAVLLKGGHFHDTATDLLLTAGGEAHAFPAARIATPHTHGTGCTYSAAITALLATQTPLPEAVARAKQYITEAIATNPGLGHGSGPVNHHAGSQHSILQRLTINAPATRVFALFAEPVQLSDWWTLEAHGSPAPGAVWRFDFGPGFDWRGVITGFTENAWIEWEFTVADQDWTGTRAGARFTADSEDPHRTIVDFYHTGWAEPHEHFRVTTHGWAIYLRLLRRLAEQGERVPYADRGRA